MEATVQRKTLTMEDRKVLAEMWAAGERAAVIAVKLGVCPDTVYKELKRGYTGTLNELSRPAYDPARGQAEYQRHFKASSASALLNGMAVLIRDYAETLNLSVVEVLSVLAVVLTMPTIQEKNRESEDQ